ncbi:MAG: 3',5'-cyclic-AMP phosphodiesterase [Pseudomonadaceae bacterium]|nr:MAG: 3',5'-cyclic-AMP phosphodiesterase [Pseudomonadaceae bacterium]
MSGDGHQQTIHLVQLTDCHLYADEQTELLGLDTHASLQAVIDQVLQQIPKIDLVLATGDIAQDASESAYQHFMQAAKRLPAPCHWIPGNHDDALRMSELGAADELTQPWHDLGPWRIVMLDSSVAGSVAGRLAPAQFELLEQALASAGDRFILLTLHHHPVDIGCDWMRPIGLHNADQLFQRIEHDPRVKVVLWGHIHQDYDEQRGHLRLLATPSTCIQFAPNSHDFSTDTQAPGYRWLRLHADGSLETGVERVAQGRFVADPEASGY